MGALIYMDVTLNYMAQVDPNRLLLIKGNLFELESGQQYVIVTE